MASGKAIKKRSTKAHMGCKSDTLQTIANGVVAHMKTSNP